jgi:hypothetical protein
MMNDQAAIQVQTRQRFLRGPCPARTSAQPRLLRLLALLTFSTLHLPIQPAEFSPETIELFEKRIRPILVESCHQCHSATAEKLKGGLRLDSRAGLLAGGETGPVIVPGHPDKSRLVEAIRYGNPELQMPPKNKLAADKIEDLVSWIKLGAPWPEEASGATTISKQPSFDLEKRRREHWSWQPVRAPVPPEVKNRTWPAQPIDHFILNRLEEAGLGPAPPAEPRSLLRRLYFDLIGLPPSASAIDQFLANPDDYNLIVDRLLASPRFGERWARHWLDLVRYAETLGHEYDYANPNAWRYRDYVIRAFNADVAYPQFALEHIAGDLLPAPRRHPVEGFNESIIGPAFYWLGQRDHSPVDVRLHEAELIDNQIDVLSKTFLGLTVACARCHDHKFDAIATKDYYALFGVLSSSRYAQRSIDSEADQQTLVRQLQEGKTRIRAAVAESWVQAEETLAAYLAAAGAALAPPAQRDTIAQQFKVDPGRLERWIGALRDPAAPASASNSNPPPVTASSLGPDESVFVDFNVADYRGWFVEGAAFGQHPAAPGDFVVGNSNQPAIALIESGAAHSALLSRRLQGALRSPTFTIEKRYLHVLAAGRESRLNVPVDNLTMIRDPIYGTLKRVFNFDQPRWITIDLDMWKGHRAYLEFSKVSTPDPSDDAHKDGFAPDGWMAVQRVIFSNRSTPPRLPPAATTEVESATAAGSATAGTPASERSTPGGAWSPALKPLQEAVAAWAADKATPPQLALVSWLARHRLLEPDSTESARPFSQLSPLAKAIAEYRLLEKSIPDPRRAPSMVDGTGIDERIFIRGNHKSLGDEVPRRFLEALGGTVAGRFREGSGRLELARHIVDPGNPLFARVFVNRVWLHLFGRGIVPTPDDFGVLGQPPTHPEMLDWLAHWFQTEGGGQPKALIKLLVTSRAYQMSSRPDDPGAEEKDPANLLWHRAEVRRLEGEAIRDSILAVSGQLDTAMFGPPIPIHLTEFMDGRGRPATSGPLDGAGRRSIYVEVRRNFVSPMMRAFDTPVPHSTVGRRTVSNVPAQSLMLLNDPFVVEQAKLWARRLLAAGDRSSQERIRRVYLETFGRPPLPAEQAEALAFLERHGAAYGASPAAAATDARVWADLCHVMWNVKEFVFIN